MKHIKFVLLIMILTVGQLHAQWNYVVDVVGGDSTALVKPVNTMDGFAMGDTIGWLHNSDTVFVAKVDSGFVDNSLVTITLDNQKYFVDRKDLAFGDNPVERTDFVNNTTDARNRHYRWGHLYLGGVSLYWLIFVLVLLAMFFALTRVDLLLVFVPLLLLVVTIIEVYGLLCFGRDMLWWVEGAKFHSWHDISRLLLFALAVILQVGSLYIYRKRISGDDYEDLVVWRPVFSALLAGIVAVVVIVACVAFRFSQKYVFISAGVAFVIVVGRGFIKSVKENCDVLGIFRGILFTLFVLIWGVGTLAAIILLVISVLNAISVLVALAIVGVPYLVLMLLAIGSRSEGPIFSIYEKPLDREEKERKEKQEYEERQRRQEVERRREEVVRRQEEDRKKRLGW